MNLFGNPNTPNDGGFLNQPSWAQTMVELARNADGEPGPRTTVCTSLDFLMRTQESILIHELMHVQGIGQRQSEPSIFQPTCVVLTKRIQMVSASSINSCPALEVLVRPSYGPMEKTTSRLWRGRILSWQ